MTEYTVHFQRGTQVGARSLRMITVEATSVRNAIAQAHVQFPDAREQRYRLIRVDHFENGRIVID